MKCFDKLGLLVLLAADFMEITIIGLLLTYYGALLKDNGSFSHCNVISLLYGTNATLNLKTFCYLCFFTG